MINWYTPPIHDKQYIIKPSVMVDKFWYCRFVQPNHNLRKVPKVLKPTNDVLFGNYFDFHNQIQFIVECK